jgi:hypothetical protein
LPWYARASADSMVSAAASPGTAATMIAMTIKKAMIVIAIAG